jgi:hypothetical protein
MVAALLKILHSGIQDLRLLPPKGQPAVEFFKKAFIKAGRFTTQWVRLDFDQIPNFGKTATITLPRQGHLISRVYLVANFPEIATYQQEARTAAGLSFAGPTYGWTNSLGHALVQSAQIDIGGARVSTLDSRLLEVLDEFNTPFEKVTIVNEMIKRLDNGFTNRKLGWPGQGYAVPTQVAVPLPFWFSRGDAGAFLPIDAISTDLVRLSVTFAPLDSLYASQELSGNIFGRCEGTVYPQILGSKFYRYDASGTLLVGGFDGNPTPQRVSPIPTNGMPTTLNLGDTYLMCEYVYLDKAEANRFRLADIILPISQHYAFEPYNTKNFTSVQIPLRIPNPTRDLFFFAQRVEAPSYNAHFLATRDLSGFDVTVAPWWPDASGLKARYFTGEYIPAFTYRESEPISNIALVYEGRLVRYGTPAPALFRTILPTIQQRKTPWVNKYYYNLSFGILNGFLPPSNPSGEANLDKIRRIELQLTFAPLRGCAPGTPVPDYIIYIWAETYNILRIYGGRAALMFAY